MSDPDDEMGEQVMALLADLFAECLNDAKELYCDTSTVDGLGC